MSPRAVSLTVHHCQVLHGRDLSGKVAIVTGANCGIGYETVRAMAFHGAHVIMVCRDLEKAREAITRIVAERVSCLCTLGICVHLLKTAALVSREGGCDGV